MKTKHAEDLAKEYGWDYPSQYFEYIVESLINGQRQQVRDLFNRMSPDSKDVFLNQYLEDDNSFHTSTRRICVSELI